MEQINKLGTEIQDAIATANFGSKEEYAILEIMQKLNERMDLIVEHIKSKPWRA